MIIFATFIHNRIHMSIDDTLSKMIYSRKKTFYRLLAAVFLLLMGLPFNQMFAQGNLLITPRRVVFEGSKRNQDLNLANTGSDSATYSVSLIHYRMKDDGSFEQILEPDSGQLFADKYIRFFPRQVSLAPNEAQVVKMQLTRTGELSPGEYRSHIYFRALPKQGALGEEDLKRDTTSISVKLTPIFGITIPVIIRVGDSDAHVTISGLTLETINDTVPRLSMTFNRSGNMSVYGDLEISHISAKGKVTQVGFIKGIAVYCPNRLRNFRIDLANIPDLRNKSGKLHLKYVTQTAVNPIILAEADLILE